MGRNEVWWQNRILLLEQRGRWKVEGVLRQARVRRRSLFLEPSLGDILSQRGFQSWLRNEAGRNGLAPYQLWHIYNNGRHLSLITWKTWKQILALSTSDSLTLFPVNRNDSDLYWLIDFTLLFPSYWEPIERCHTRPHDVCLSSNAFCSKADLRDRGRHWCSHSADTQSSWASFQWGHHPGFSRALCWLWSLSTLCICPTVHKAGWPASSSCSEMPPAVGFIHVGIWCIILSFQYLGTSEEGESSENFIFFSKLIDALGCAHWVLCFCGYCRCMSSAFKFRGFLSMALLWYDVIHWIEGGINHNLCRPCMCL